MELAEMREERMEKQVALEATAMYMNTATGSVASGAEWLADQKELDFPESDLEKLVRVEEKDGEWIEA